MSKNHLTDHNATPLDDGSGLRGGTQGGGNTADLMPVNHMPSTPMSAAPSGADTSQQGQARDHGDPTDALNLASGDGTRHPSANEAKAAAREAADIPPDLSRSGFNEHDPANEHRTDTSSGNHASTSGRKLFDAPEDEDDPN